MHTFWSKAGRWQNVLSLANMLHYFISSSYELPAALPAAFSLLYIIRQKGVFNKMNKPNENGRSMIEMLGVLAIIGVLSVGGIAGYSKAMEQFKINKTMQQITEIITNTRTLYAQQKDFDGLINKTAVEMGIIPSDLQTSPSNWGYYMDIKNVFEGDVIVAHGGYNMSQYFKIVFTDLSKNACIALGTANWGTEQSSGIVGITIGYVSALLEEVIMDKGEDCKEGDTYGSYYACSGYLPLSPAKIAQYCSTDLKEFGILLKK